MTPVLKYYVTALTCVAGSMLLRGGLALPPDTWLPLSILAVFAAIFEILPMELPNGTRFTLGSAVYFVAYLGFGRDVALWVVTIAVAAYAIVMREQYFRALFNGSNYILSLTLAGRLFSLAGGTVGTGQWSGALPIAVFVLTDFFVNTGLLSVIFWQISGQPMHRVWLTLGLDAYLGHFAVMTIGLLAATLMDQGLPLLIALFLILFFLQRLFASYFKLLGASRQREDVLNTILNSTDNGILMVDGSGVIRHANSQVADYFGMRVQTLVGSPVSDLPLPEASEVDQHEFILRHPVERNLRYNRAPIGGGDQSTGMVISLTDITSEREAARKLKEYEGSIRTLVAAVDARDEYTYGHSERVSEYGVRLGERLGLSRQEIDDLRHGGLLHDIGKIGIDDRILRKSGALTPEERALMMEHPAKGGAILAQAGAFSTIMPVVLYHHEWYGGGGYPTGRKGNQIPLLARITSVADAFDAMTSHRHYRAGMPVEEALLRLEEGRGTQFDPNAVSMFVDGMRSGAIPVLNRPTDLPAPAAIDAEATGRILPVHRQELRVIYRIALETRLFLDLERLLPRVLEILSETLGAEQYYLALVNSGDEPPEVVAETSGQGNSGVAEGEIVDWVLRTGQPVLFSRHEVPETAHLRPRYDSTGSALGVALEAGGTVVGALCCESLDVDRYNGESLYLMKAVAGQVASAIQIARYHERVRDSAIRDGLTGAYNHTYFYDEGERHLAEARKGGLPIALAVLDVNDMKMVNDRHGHLAGDRVLRYFAGLLAGSIREEDMLARCGGDEFMIIMPGLSHTEASMLMSDIVRSVADSIEWNDESIPLAGLAWGVAAHPEDGARLMELINTADRAMYSQKRSRHVIRLRASS